MGLFEAELCGKILRVGNMPNPAWDGTLHKELIRAPSMYGDVEISNIFELLDLIDAPITTPNLSKLVFVLEWIVGTGKAITEEPGLQEFLDRYAIVRDEVLPSFDETLVSWFAVCVNEAVGNLLLVQSMLRASPRMFQFRIVKQLSKR